MGFWNKLFKKKEEEEKVLEEKVELLEEEQGMLGEQGQVEEEQVGDKTSVEELSNTITKEEKAEDSLEEEDKTEEEKEEKKRKGLFASLHEKLFKTREGLFSKIKFLFSSRKIIDEEMYEELEELLIQSDIGLEMTQKIVKDLEQEVKAKKVKEASEVYSVLQSLMEGYLLEGEAGFLQGEGLQVLLIVGVNGVGKTTTIGKLASKLKKEGKKVILGAGDTFRAAAVEQLEEWAKRAEVPLVKGKENADPGSVVYDTLTKAEEIGADVAIIDTAGRLHNKQYLMKELEKINNVVKKKIGEKHYESLLVIDGTTGQNALNQAKQFNEVTRLTGFVITKLDGTAKGGIVFSVSQLLKLPIRFIGVGEKVEDLREFSSKDFVAALFQ